MGLNMNSIKIFKISPNKNNHTFIFSHQTKSLNIVVNDTLEIKEIIEVWAL